MKIKLVMMGVVCCLMVTAVLAVACSAAPVLIPAPQKVVVGKGSHSVVAEKVDAALAAFERDATIPAEGYALSISTNGIRVKSADAAGAFYAIQTLKQLAVAEKGRLTFPCVEIEDSPAYRWRGVHFDDCRHFFGRETLKKTLDLMAQHKMNILHWHLTEDQGWQKGSCWPGGQRWALPRLGKRLIRKGVKS